MTSSEIVETLKIEIKGLSDAFVPDDYLKAIEAADRDTGWSAPYAGSFKEKWTLLRAKRHLFFAMLSESAHKFKYKQINLQHRFDHYRELVKDLEEAWVLAQEEHPAEFAGVEAYEMFGQKVDAGFATEPHTGQDLTYDEDQLVIINVDIPSRLTSNQRQLFEQLADTLGSEVLPQERSFLDILKDVLGG